MQRSSCNVCFYLSFIWGQRGAAHARTNVHTRAAVILMDSPTEEWGEDRNMMFAQTVQ